MVTTNMVRKHNRKPVVSFRKKETGKAFMSAKERTGRRPISAMSIKHSSPTVRMMIESQRTGRLILAQ
jgi:hypothetical protein